MNSPSSKATGLLWVLAAALIAAGAALALPHAARRLPWSVERWLGRVVDAATPGRLCHGAPPGGADQALDLLVRRIYPLVPGDERVTITVEVMHGDVVNAFATLGGHIFVLDGLLRQARSPEELAGVLAHEIEHVRSRHIIQGVGVNLLTLIAVQAAFPQGGQIDPRIAHQFLTLHFSRQAEAEADELGLQRLRAALVDAGAFAQFFARAGSLPAPPPFLSNHPSNASRAEMAARFAGYAARPVLDDGQWKALVNICR